MNIKSFIRLGSKLPEYWLSRSFGINNALPINLTLNVSYRCNSKCLTCNVWRRKVKDLTLDEWEIVFKNIGFNPFWLILSGGEPFLRKDLVEIVKLSIKYLKPNVINIPTNGLLWQIIPDTVEKILKIAKNSVVIINFSIDGIRGEHDKIRGVKSNFHKLIKSYERLKLLKDKYPNLTIGLHTVISKYNVNKFDELSSFALSLNPDQYITEIAENRSELDNHDLIITPPYDEYYKVINLLINKLKKEKFKGISKITEAIRIEYYNLVKRILLEKRQIIPCYSGWAAAQISADGEVWPCCVRADSMGDLRSNNYDFKMIWNSDRARKIRQSIKDKECWCPLASASYTNILLEPKTLLRVLLSLR